MILLQFFAAIILLLDTSVRTYSVPYESSLAFSTISRLIYTASKSNPTLSGYSYATQDLSGDGSNVVFTTGVDSVSRLKNEMNSIYKANDKNTPDTYLQEDTLKIPRTTISSELTSEKVETNTTKKIQENLESNVEIFNEEKELPKNPEVNDNFVEYQIAPQVSFVRVPYSAPNLLNLHLPTVNEHYPLPSSKIEVEENHQHYFHDPYAHLELRLHNFDFYNPTVPLFYQPAITVSDSSFRLEPTISEDVKKFMDSPVTKTSRTNVNESNLSKSNVELRSNFGTTTNITNEILSNKSSSTNKPESMITSERVKDEIINNESTNSTEIFKISVEETVENKANSTESTNSKYTETTSSTKKSSAETM